MMKTVRHSRKELKHAENREKRYFVNKPVKPVKVNNFLFMDNQERFENVCLGYSIQAERLMKVIQKNTAGKITKDWVTPERKMTIEQSSVIMETIQFQWLECLLFGLLFMLLKNVTECYSRQYMQKNYIYFWS